MPLFPSLLERLLYKLNIFPAPLLDLQAAGVFRAVSLSLRLGIFESLGRRSLTSAEVAQSIGANERGVTILLEALAAFGYLKHQNERYTNAPITAKWLLRDSPMNIIDFIVGWWDSLVFQFWDGHIEEAIREGKPALSIYGWLEKNPGGLQASQAAFSSLAASFGYTFLARLKVPRSARRLLDVGGGHGLYSIELCRKNPNLTATVFDHPATLEIARRNIESKQMEGRVAVQPGDFLKDNLGSGYDVALLMNVVHGYLPEENIELLRKIAAALNPRGQVVIWDQFVEKMRLFPSLRKGIRFFSLTALVTQGGQNYPVAEVSRWLKATGFENVKKLFGIPLIIAVKAS